MTNKPPTGFKIELADGTLTIPGQDRPSRTQPTLDLRVSGIHHREITISLHQAKQLTKKSIEHGNSGLEDYSPEIKNQAESWAAD